VLSVLTKVYRSQDTYKLDLKTRITETSPKQLSSYSLDNPAGSMMFSLNPLVISYFHKRPTRAEGIAQRATRHKLMPIVIP